MSQARRGNGSRPDGWSGGSGGAERARAEWARRHRARLCLQSRVGRRGGMQSGRCSSRGGSRKGGVVGRAGLRESSWSEVRPEVKGGRWRQNTVK